MSPVNTAPNVVVYLLVFLCFVPAARALQTTDASEAIRLTATADDNATTLEERRAALKKLEAAVPLFLSAGETVEAARVLNRVGHLQLILNDPKAALDSHAKALNLLKHTSSNETQIDNLNGLAEAYLRLQKLALAEPVLHQAMALSEGSKYTAGQAQALLILSDLQNNENHILALQTAQQALTLWQTLDDKSKLALTYTLVGQCYLAQNLLSEATQNYQTALQLSQDLNDKSGQAGALIALGFIEYRKGSWQDAIAYHTRAQELVDDKDEPKRMGQVAVGLGEAFNESGLPETGLVHFQRAEEYYRRIEDPAFVAYAIFGLGRSYYLLGNYTEAASQFHRALAEVSDDSLQAAQFHEHLGRVYIATREYPLALKYLQSALATYVRSGNQMEAAQAQGLMAEIYQQQGRISLARQYYQRSLQTFIRLSDRLNQSAIFFALGRFELRQNNLDPAEDYLRQSIDVTEDMRRVSTSSDLTIAFSATVHERYEGYIECLMRKHQTQPGRELDARAFETSELARARSLAELLHATQTNLAPGVDPQLAEQEKSLRQSLSVKENDKVALLGKTYRREELEALETEITRLETQYKQVNETIKARYPAYDQMNRPTAWDLPRIQKQIIADDQTVLLEYSLGAERSYVWAVTRDRIASYELPSQTKINEAAQKVYGLLAAAGDAQSEPELTQAAQELGQMILLPVAAELSKQRLIVVADGALNYIPFQFLPAPSDGGEPLVASHEVINVPSASILGQVQLETTRRQAPTKLLAAFGDPVFASNYAERKDAKTSEQIASLQAPEGERWRPALRDIEPAGDSFDSAAIQPLFYSKLELANLRELAGPETLMATGFDASRENLERSDLTKYAILHFATHGILDPKRPENSGLFLSMVDREGHAQNGFVGLPDIYRLHAPVDLVVLSACRTGLGKDVRGEGLIGLTRGFMYAGASSVMASLWKVDDEATAELMKRFYANMLQRGMTPAAALRAAQNSIRQEPQWRSPHFWAAFTLQGEYNKVIEHGSRTPRRVQVVIALSVLLLLAVALWWYRRSRPRRAKQSAAIPR